jgi:hypothetical protein
LEIDLPLPASPLQKNAQTGVHGDARFASQSAHKAGPVDGLRIGLNLLLMVAQAAVPAVTQIPAFIDVPGLTDIGTRSAQSPSSLTPPDFSFAIWGLIFAAMAGYAVYQALPANWAAAQLRRVGWWTAAAMALNTTWEFVTAWRGITFATVVLIFLMLVVLLKAFSALHDGQKLKPVETALVVFPISIFAAWITVACVLNSVSWLFNAGGVGFGGVAEGTWAGAFAALAGAIGAAVIWIHRGNAFYTAVLIWAFGGIIYKAIGLSESVLLAGAVVGLVIAFTAFVRRPDASAREVGKIR